MAPPNPLAGAHIKIEVKQEQDDYGDAAGYLNPWTQQSPPPQRNLPAGKPLKQRIPAPSRGPSKSLATNSIICANRRRLSGILRDLVRAHKWRETSGILSVLLSGIPRNSSVAEDRFNFMIAMEHQKRFRAGNYQLVIKQIYEMRMAKLAWTRKEEKKKHEISLELALFYITQGNIEAAKDSMRFLVEDPDSANVPTVNLTYGLILYQLWYSHLLKEMKEKGFDISILPETYGMPFNDDSGEQETAESSNDHNAVNIEDARFSSQCASESSVGNDKNIFTDSKNDVPAKQNVFAAHGFYMSRSADVKEEGAVSPDHDNFSGGSIFLAHGLETSLLPIRLKRMSGDLEQIIRTYRKLANENYRDAAKHLRRALYSRQPLLAALLPLIQLLLLGDRVEEAIKELENFCDILNTALPFRLRARLLEVFHSSQTTMISSCYENVLKRDPTCNQSLDSLIRMHKTGNYNSILLLEMITLHLDAVNGNCSIWEEFASCFLKLVYAAVSEFEDCISTNVLKVEKDLSSSRKVPKALTLGQASGSWRIRCRWWVRRHFSNDAYLSEMQAGDWQLLTAKAACASHLYGPRFEYVISVLRTLRKEGKKDEMPFLLMHMQHSMKLDEDLGKYPYEA